MSRGTAFLRQVNTRVTELSTQADSRTTLSNNKMCLNKMKAISLVYTHNKHAWLLITIKSWKTNKNCNIILTCICLIARSTRRVLPLSSFVRRIKADVWMAQNLGCESKHWWGGKKKKRPQKKWINWIIHSEYNKINISGYSWVTTWKSSQRKIKDDVRFQMFLEKNVFIWAESLLNWADLFNWINSLRNESELFPENRNSKWNKSYH